MNKKIILTFDYEMYLGKDSGSIEKCMIEPTYKILNIFNQNNASGLFFVDATFLLVLKKDFYEGYLKVKNQIIDILKRGSDIGLHIHPHWIDSYMIEKGKWSFKSYDKFRIHNLSKEDKNKLILDSFNELNLIVKEYDKNYKIDSFRAGGWSIQPFSYIKDTLEKIGIKYDFSVLPGMKLMNLPKHYYDYTKAPNKDFWKFTDDVLVENKNGRFIEIPTTTIKMNIIDILSLKKEIEKYKVIGDGKGADDSSKGFFKKFKKLALYKAYAFTSDYMTFKFFKKNLGKINKSLIVYVAHPKNFSEESFKILEYISKNHIIIKKENILC